METRIHSIHVNDEAYQAFWRVKSLVQAKVSRRVTHSDVLKAICEVAEKHLDEVVQFLGK